VEQPADAVQRLFFAVLLPPELRATVAAAGQPLREVVGLRWTRPEALHLTYAFRGPLGPVRPVLLGRRWCWAGWRLGHHGEPLGIAEQGPGPRQPGR